MNSGNSNLVVEMKLIVEKRKRKLRLEEVRVDWKWKWKWTPWLVLFNL